MCLVSITSNRTFQTLFWKSRLPVIGRLTTSATCRIFEGLSHLSQRRSGQLETKRDRKWFLGNCRNLIPMQQWMTQKITMLSFVLRKMLRPLQILSGTPKMWKSKYPLRTKDDMNFSWLSFWKKILLRTGEKGKRQSLKKMQRRSQLWGKECYRRQEWQKRQLMRQIFPVT